MTLPPDFWIKEDKNLMAILLPKITQFALQGVRDGTAKLTQAGIMFDPTLANAHAISWARQHTDSLLAQYGTTTRTGIGEALANWMATPGGTVGDLENLLKPLLDDNITRANRVAVTEATRALAEGNDIAYQEAGLPPMGYKPYAHVNCRCNTGLRRVPNTRTWVSVWHTDNDELVCKQPIDTHTSMGIVNGCADLHNRVMSQGPYFGKKWSDL